MDATGFTLRSNNASGVEMPSGASLLNPAGLDDGGPAQRFASMSISRNPAGCTLRGAHRFEGREVREAISVADIEGAAHKPKVSHSRETFHHTADIPGAAAKPKHVFRTGHHDVLDHSDIEGTRVRTTDLHTKRRVDPLDPRYQLPSVPDIRPADLPFKRDLITDVSDIEGTRSSALRSVSRNARAREGGERVDRTLNVDDIEGTKPVSQIRHLSGHTDPLNVRDITDRLKASKRDTNQLAPVYVVNGMVIQDPLDTKARSPKRPRDGKGDMLSLTTGDIEGARPATWGEQKVGVIRLDQRKNFTITNRVDDIEGTSAGSRPKGIRSVRPDTDPNERNYQLLDGRRHDPEDLLVGHGWYSAATNAVALEASGKLGRSSGAATSNENAGPSADTVDGTASGFRDRQVTGPGAEMLSKTAWAAQKAAAAQASDKKPVPYPQEKPTQRLARKLLDPRDAEIAALRGQLEATRSRSAGAVARPSASAAASEASSSSGTESNEPAQGSYESPYDALRQKGAEVPPSGKPSGLEVQFDPKATAKARAAIKKQASKEPGVGVGLGTLKPPSASSSDSAAKASRDNNGELSFSQMLANTIKSGQVSSNARASPLKGTKSLSATSALTLMEGTKASASQRHDTMALRRQARDRESELSSVRALPL